MTVGPVPPLAALYCSSRPSVRGSSGLRFKTWTGAYPKLAQHFKAANLDPTDNKWDKVRGAELVLRGVGSHPSAIRV